MIEDEKIKIINFLQDFSCATLRQLQILFNKPNDKLSLRCLYISHNCANNSKYDYYKHKSHP